MRAVKVEDRVPGACQESHPHPHSARVHTRRRDPTPGPTARCAPRAVHGLMTWRDSAPSMAAFEAFRRALGSDAVAAVCAVKTEATPAAAAESNARAKRRRSAGPLTAPAQPPVYAPLSPGLLPPPELARLLPAFVAPLPGLWRERYASCCAGCFHAAVPCRHYPETRLRLLFIGHNPSDHAWSSGYPFSNPSNRFWNLLRSGSIVPDNWRPCDADALPALLGIGWTDLGCEPGSDASEFKRAALLRWRTDQYDRLNAHLARVAAWNGGDTASHAPALVAFAGKRQWASLFEPPLPGGFPHGVQSSRPPGWPLPPSTEVFVLPSSSGRAVMTAAERQGPYAELGRRLAMLPHGQTHAANTLPNCGIE